MEIILTTLIIYMIGVIIIGIIASRYMKTLEDYIIAGRRLGAWVTAISYQATALSGWLFMAFAGLVYENGLSHGVWLIIASGAAPLISFILIGRGIRRLAEVTKAYTVIDLLEERFQDRTRIIRIISAIVIFICMIVYAAGQFMATGTLMSVILNIPYEHAVIYGTIIMAIYMFLGGYLAVAWTDLVQGLIMVFGAVTLSALAAAKIGGLPALLDNLESVNPKFVNPWIMPTVIAGYITAAWLGYLGQPQLVVRFMSAKGEKQVLNSIPIVSMSAPALLCGAAIASASAIILLPGLAKPEESILRLSIALFHPIIAGIFVAATLAAIMSTSDSLIIAAVSTVVRDIYNKMIRPSASQKELVWLSRIITLIACIACAAIAIRPFAEMLWVMWWGWGGLTTFAPLFILAIYWKRATREGCIAGLIAGFIASIIWFQLGWHKWLHLSVPAFVFSMVACIIVSLLTKPPETAYTTT